MWLGNYSMQHHPATTFFAPCRLYIVHLFLISNRPEDILSYLIGVQTLVCPMNGRVPSFDISVESVMKSCSSPLLASCLPVSPSIYCPPAPINNALVQVRLPKCACPNLCIIPGLVILVVRYRDQRSRTTAILWVVYIRSTSTSRSCAKAFSVLSYQTQYLWERCKYKCKYKCATSSTLSNLEL